MKKVKPVLIPELRVLGVLLNGQILLPERIAQVADMPPLRTLHAQIVGLLTSSSSQLVALLNEGGGAKLARTLEGLRESLQDENK